MKSREFVRKYLLPVGAKHVGHKGDHHIYELPNGGRIQVPMGGSQTEASKHLLSRLKRLLEQE